MIGSYLESGASILYPADDDVGVVEVAVAGQGQDDVAQGCHLDLERDFAVVDGPVHVVIGFQLQPVLQIAARHALIGRRWASAQTQYRRQ